MAVFRGISRRFSLYFSRPNPRSSSISPPSQLICYRGIVSKLFVGGLSFYTTEKSLSEAFSQFGEVVEAKIITDKASDRSKGFGFVAFGSEDEAKKALIEMNGKVLNGRNIFVDIAKPKLYTDVGLPVARGPPDPNPDT